MTAPLTPIPTPPAQQWHEFKVRFVPPIFFALTLVCTGVLWAKYVTPASLVGQVEALQANVASSKAGELVQLNLQLHQEVKAGDIVGKVLPVDPRILQANLAVIQAEMNLLRVNFSPLLADKRFEMTYDRLRLSYLSEKVALSTARTRLQLAESELRRTQELFKEKIVSQQLLEEAQTARDALLVEIKERGALMNDEEKRLAELNILPGLNGTNSTPSVDAMKAALDVQAEKLRLVEIEMGAVPLRSPISGRVSTIWKHSGESISAGEPIITVSATRTDKVTAFLIQPLQIIPKQGMEVRVRCRTQNRDAGTAKILEVGAQMQPVSKPLLRQGVQFETGLPIMVSLPPNLKVLPGELVDLTLLPDGK